MKLLKLSLTFFMALFLTAALNCTMAAKDVKKPDARQGAAVPAASVSDLVLPQAALPVLKIGGKDDPGVYLQSLDIQVEVTGNIASTRYTMVFKNRTNRVLEGELTFPLPDGRTVTHYALDVEGKMRDAVPVEKARATQVFEEIQQRPPAIDPGLLERVEGNNFRTRVYPFPRNGTRTISIGYEEELSLENGLMYYRLPMAYPNPLDKFSVKATVWKGDQKPLVPDSEENIRFDRAGGSYVASFARENYSPSRALIFALPMPANIPQFIMQPAEGSYYFLASVAPEMEIRKKQWSNNLAIIWDVSLSGLRRDLQREMEVLDIIFAEKKDANIHLYFLNNRLNKIANKNRADGEYRVVKRKWDELKNELKAAIYDGGTDFSQINLDNIGGDEILFFSDGISTLSDADFIKDAKVNRPIHAIVSSAHADYSAMRLIAGKTKGKFVNVNALSNKQLRSEMTTETLQFLGSEHGDAVREVYPSIAAPVRGNFSIAGIADKNNAELTLLFGFGNKVERQVKVRLDAKNAASKGNAHKIWAQKKIAELDLNYEENRAELTELGRQFGIVTRNTSLIVLEFISDYVLFGIPPPATEPALLAEYERLVREHKGRQDSRELDLLKWAAASAETIKKWRGVNLPPPEPKQVMPDESDDAQITPSTPSENDGAQAAPPTPDKEAAPRTSTTNEEENITRGPVMREEELARGPAGTDTRAQTQSAQAKAPSTPPSTQTSPQTKSPPPPPAQSQMPAPAKSTDAKSRAFAFESAEVVGYLDNPTPVFIIDMDDPNTDPVSLDRSFRDAIGFLATGDPSNPLSLGSWSYESMGDFSYLDFLFAGKSAGESYQLYLKRRNNNINTPAFYFNIADKFYKRGDRETALRILTSIAELGLEDAPLYRMLAYRLKEYGEYELAKFVCRKIIHWRPMEPQSYRDYALALADNGESQAALDSLHALLTRIYPANIAKRAYGINEVVVTEINRLIAKNPRLDISKIDKNLITDIPVDIRVVINWNMDNVDVDLNLQTPSSDDKNCYIGAYWFNLGNWSHKCDDGRFSANNKSGYGPEQYLLKNAVKGKYRIYANYNGKREFASTDPVTVMAEIYTKYAGGGEQRQVIIRQLQLSQMKKDMLIAELEF